MHTGRVDVRIFVYVQSIQDIGLFDATALIQPISDKKYHGGIGVREQELHMRPPRLGLCPFGPIESSSNSPHHIAVTNQVPCLPACIAVDGGGTSETFGTQFFGSAMRRGQPALCQALTLSFRKSNLAEPE